MSTLTESPADVAVPRPRPRAADWIVVAACSLLVLAALAPELVVTDSMPLGTDLTGHPVVSWFDRSNPLGFLPGSWSDDMFNGFPVNGLYPWLPSWLVGMASYVVPFAVATKLGVVVPLVALPWAAWRAGSWSGLVRPMPVMLALATLPVIFDSSCGSCGGTVIATINGEFAFAWSLVFGVLALGAVDRLAREGRGLATAALLVTATAFSHPLTTLWLLVGIGVVAIGREVWRDRLVCIPFLTAAVIAMLLSAMWWIPFIAYQDWAPDNPLVRDGSTLSWLFPGPAVWEALVTLAGIAGAFWAVRRRAWLLIALGLMSVAALVTFLRFTDGGPFYSIRALPFWQLGRWALAAVGFAWLVQVAVARLRTDRGRATPAIVAPTVWLVLALVTIGSTWGWWGVTRAATATTDGTASVLGVEVPVTSAAAGVRRTFAGFAARPDFVELQAVRELLRDVGTRSGCGTLMWDDGDPAAEGGPVFGDAQVFWQSSIWTDGCIRSADGVLVDSSMTAPAMAMTKSLVSESVEPLLPGRPQFAYDLATGVTRMQAMGVTYYLTHGGRPATDAATTSGLAEVAAAGPWQMWRVTKGVPVVSATNLPAVFEPRLSDGDWEAVSTRYFTASTFTDVALAQDGTVTWPRSGVTALPGAAPTPFAGVTGIRADGNEVTFRVATTGTPVLVRASAFPGWTVDGADGPYRVTANYLAVVPTSTTVTLTKGRTGIDLLAIASAILGLGLLASVSVFGVLERREDRLDEPAPVESGEDEASDGDAESTHEVGLGDEADAVEPTTSRA